MRDGNGLGGGGGELKVIAKERLQNGKKKSHPVCQEETSLIDAANPEQPNLYIREGKLCVVSAHLCNQRALSFLLFFTQGIATHTKRNGHFHFFSNVTQQQ